MQEPNRIVIAGGTGFLGQLLASYFTGTGREVVVLTRRQSETPATSAKYVLWDGRSSGPWVQSTDGALAVINLAGRSVNCRYNARNRRLIMDSRVHSTRALGEAIRNSRKPPRAWLNSSTATIYRHNFGSPWDESGEIGSHPDAKDAFSVQVATEWERTLEHSPTPDTRKIALRTAMVLGTGSNSVFPTLRRLVRCGLGGRMGNGRQFVSWIHEIDFCRAIEWLIGRDDIIGPVNLAAPNPVTNEEMLRTLREVGHRRLGLPATTWMLETGAWLLRTETELIIKSRRVIPGRLLKMGFVFQFASIREAFSELEGRFTNHPA